MPDLSEDPIEPKYGQTKSFSSRFVTQVKPDSARVVRRKKSGLVDDHFEAVIGSSSEDEYEDGPPCNCPRHSMGKQDFKSQSRHRLKSSHQLHDSSLGKT